MITDTADGAIVHVKVIPRAGKTALVGARAGAVLIRLAAAPVDGGANAELIAFLSTFLVVPKRQITIVAGEKNRSKRVKVLGVSAATLRQRFDLTFDAR